MYIYKLYIKDHAKFHIGKHELNDKFEHIHSDTLFSSLINCYILLYGKNSVNDILNLFLKRRFIISSVFYFIDIFKKNIYKNTLYFFPNPGLLFNKPSTQNDFLSAKYLSLKLFTELIYNFRIETIMSKSDSEVISISDDFCAAVNEIPENLSFNIKQKIIEQKASFNIDRMHTNNIKSYSETNIILNMQLFESVTVKPGMFFLAEIKPDLMDIQSLVQRIDASINLLCDEGIGGRRSSGKGQFLNIEKNEFNYERKLFNDAECKINLSLVSPGTNELKYLKENIIKYSSVIRSGWTPNNIKLKNIRMISEGSLFTNKLKGRLVNVAPIKFKEHKIYRNGVGFYL